MKKTLLALFLLTMTIVFTGCSLFKTDKASDEPKLPTTATELDAMAEEKLCALDSYSATETTSGNFTVNDVYFEFLSTTEVLVSGQNSDNYADETETSLVTSYKEKNDLDSVTEAIYLTEGFTSGTWYRNSTVGQSGSNIKSEISKENYLSFRKEREEKKLAEIGNATPASSELERLENGGWKGTLTDFDPEYTSNYLYSLLGDDVIFETSVEDMTVTIITTEDFVYESIAIDFELVNPDGAKKTIGRISCKMEFSDVNSTYISPVDLSEYSPIDDIRAIYAVEDVISEAKDIESGKIDFLFEDTKPIPGYIPGTTTVREESTLTFSKSNGISYNLTSVSDDIKFLQTYSEGKVTAEIFKNDLSYGKTTTDSTDEEQKIVLDSFIDYISFDPLLVYDVKIPEEGTYLVSLHPNDSQKIYGTTVKIELEITVTNGKLSKYLCTIGKSHSSSPYKGTKIEAIYEWD